MTKWKRKFNRYLYQLHFKSLVFLQNKFFAGACYKCQNTMATFEQIFMCWDFLIGRAGRFGSQWGNGGLVTTYKAEDLPILQEKLNQKPEPLQQAGLHPTDNGIKMLSIMLPKISFTELLVWN